MALPVCCLQTKNCVRESCDQVDDVINNCICNVSPVLQYKFYIEKMSGSLNSEKGWFFLRNIWQLNCEWTYKNDIFQMHWCSSYWRCWNCFKDCENVMRKLQIVMKISKNFPWKMGVVFFHVPLSRKC